MTGSRPARPAGPLFTHLALGGCVVFLAIELSQLLMDPTRAIHHYGLIILVLGMLCNTLAAFYIKPGRRKLVMATMAVFLIVLACYYEFWFLPRYHPSRAADGRARSSQHPSYATALLSRDRGRLPPMLAPMR